MLYILIIKKLIVTFTFEGYNQFQSGWVSAVKHYLTDSGVTILTAAAMYSQALNENKL